MGLGFESVAVVVLAVTMHRPVQSVSEGEFSCRRDEELEDMYGILLCHGDVYEYG
jgi:hypothetical protein